MFKKLKQKRCKNCIHKFKEGSLYCCHRPSYHGKEKIELHLLRPLQLFCFHKCINGKKVEKC